eukprot:scaffold110326_cov23-Cyclotella_meneghiniana.AAC.1
MASVSASMALSKVDLPMLGRPMIVMRAHRCGMSLFCVDDALEEMRPSVFLFLQVNAVTACIEARRHSREAMAGGKFSKLMVKQ